jgi:thiamine biosynthesis lipoprotein
MGTSYSVQVVKREDGTANKDLSNGIQSALDLIDNLMSTWQPDSELMQFNAASASKWFAVSDDTFHVIRLAQDISEKTGGAFDITLEPLIELWGFSAKYTNDRVPSPAEVNQARSQTGYSNLLVNVANHAIKKEKSALRLNVSAIAKGYAVDKVADYLAAQGYDNYLVEVGGEIRARGSKSDGTKWKIAIESPVTDGRKVQQIMSITDEGMATSGDYRNYFEKDGKRYSHTIDPATGYPITHRLASVTVISKKTAVADALATALMVMGTQKGFRFCQKNRIPAYFIFRTSDGFGTRHTAQFQAYLAKR